MTFISCVLSRPQSVHHFSNNLALAWLECQYIVVLKKYFTFLKLFLVLLNILYIMLSFRETIFKFFTQKCAIL